RMFAVTVFGQYFSGSVQENFSPVLVPMQVYNGALQLRPAIGPQPFLSFNAVSDCIFNLQICKQRSRYSRIVYVGSDRDVTVVCNHLFPRNGKRSAVQGFGVVRGKALKRISDLARAVKIEIEPDTVVARCLNFKA